MRKYLIIILAIAVWILSIGAERNEPRQVTPDFEQAEFQKVYVTAYCCGTHTANGTPVHYGCMAVSNEHFGDVAILYTADGEYIDIFEGNDKGGTDAIREGRVVDVYFPTIEECRAFMAKVANSGGFCYIKYISGKG